MDHVRAKQISKFCTKYHLEHVDVTLIDQSLTHKSYANELKKQKRSLLHQFHNQRLEFLGDAVLGMVIARELYRLFPEANEGELTKRKSQAVCEPTLGEIAKKMQIGDYLLMGKGESSTGGNIRISNLADALEALIGCIFISNGFSHAEEFILTHWEPYLSLSKSPRFSIDYKSHLQEHLVKDGKLRPEYRVLSTEGPEHNKEFLIGLFIKGVEVTRGLATSRKKAEQKAAYSYLSSKGLLE